MRRLVALISLVLVAGMLPPPVSAGDPPAGLPSTGPATEVSPTATPDPTGTPDPTASPAAAPSSERPSHPDAGGPAGPVEPLADPAATTTSIVLTYPYGTVGIQHDFHVQTNPAPPGGTVDLLVDGTVVTSGTFTGDNPAIHLYWTPVAPGELTVTARYNGTAGYAGSTSDGFALLVFLPTPYITVSASNDAPAFGETVDFTASLSPDPGSGTIEWSVNDVLAASVALEPGGVSHFSTSFSAPYVHSVKAHFTGTPGFLPSTGNRNLYLAPLATTMTITLPPDPIPAGPVTATVTLSPSPGGGTLTWHTTHTGDVTVDADPDGTTEIPMGTFAWGDHGVSVLFSGYGQYAGTQEGAGFTVLQTAAVTLSANRTTAVAGELPVVLTAVVEPHDIWVGTVTFIDDVGGSVVELGPVTYAIADGRAVYSSSGLRVGTHTIRARFNGVNGVFVPALSDPVTVIVVADTAVHATFTPSASWFYPYRDGYRDTVSLGGTLDETATVTIRIYSSYGTLKRTYSLGTKPAGRFGVAWTGRTASGKTVAAGKYTVKVSLRDARGHTRTIAGTTSVSWRQVTWKTATSVARYGDEFSYFATPGDHLFLSQDESRGRVLVSAPMNPSCEPACATIYGYTTFGLTTKGLAYRSVRVTATGHGFIDFEHSGDAFFVAWSQGMPAFQGPLPEYLSQPMTYTASPSAHVSPDRKVRFGVWCTEAWGDAFDLHSVRLTYQYAVWKS